MRCSDCRRYKTEECLANPAGENWISAESYSCFTPKGNLSVDAEHAENQIDRQKIYEEEKARAEAKERIRKEQAAESGKKIGKGCLVIAAGLAMLVIIIAIIAIVAAPGEEPSQIQPALTSEQAYAADIFSQTTALASAFTELSELLQTPRIGDDDWTIKVATQLVTMQMVYNEALEIEAPDSMSHIHLKYVQALKHYNSATEKMAQGIDAIDTDLLNEATSEMETGTELLYETTQLLLQFAETL